MQNAAPQQKFVAHRWCSAPSFSYEIGAQQAKHVIGSSLVLRMPLSGWGFATAICSCSFFRCVIFWHSIGSIQDAHRHSKNMLLQRSLPPKDRPAELTITPLAIKVANDSQLLPNTGRNRPINVAAGAAFHSSSRLPNADASNFESAVAFFFTKL